jgi:hypothetical protein
MLAHPDDLLPLCESIDGAIAYYAHEGDTTTCDMLRSKRDDIGRVRAMLSGEDSHLTGMLRGAEAPPAHQTFRDAVGTQWSVHRC